MSLTLIHIIAHIGATFLR